MDKSALGRVLDPGTLDAAAGPRARLRVDVPAAWLAEGADLVVTAPARLACARCDGGGCDACERSGALRAPSDAGDRLVRATVSPSSAQRTIALRIPHPFGQAHGIEQLLLELRAAASPSPCVARVEPPVQVAPEMAAGAPLPWPVFVVVVVAGVLFALFGR